MLRSRFWTCIACSTIHRNAAKVDSSEGGLCSSCGSTWRDRAVLAAVLQGIGERGKLLKDVEADWSRRIIGVSDSTCVSSSLSSRFDYTNTRESSFPKLDLLSPPEDTFSFASVVTCSDVLEHVDGDILTAARTIHQMLKPQGFAVVSVPMPQRQPGEHYPGIQSWRLATTTELVTELHWTDSSGHEYTDQDPELHLAPEPCLVFRSFNQDSLMRLLTSAGLNPVLPLEPVPKHGVPPLACQPIMMWLAYKPAEIEGIPQDRVS